MHVASSYYYDVEPCIKAKIPVIWVNRNKETLDASQKKPTAEVKTLLEAAKLLGAALGRAVRAVGLHADVIAVTSRAYATACVLVRTRRRGVLHRLAGVPGRARDPARRSPSRRASTVVGAARDARRLGSPARRATRSRRRRWACAETTAARLINEPGAAQRELRDFDDELYVDAARRRCRCRARSSCPCRGTATSASRRSSCTRPTGTPRTGWRLDPVGARARRRRLPLAGRDPDDLRRRSAAAYLATLAGSSRWSSRPTTSSRATAGRSTARAPLAILREDRAYLEALRDRGAERAAAARAPHAAQRAIHAENARRVAG